MKRLQSIVAIGLVFYSIAACGQATQPAERVAGAGAAPDQAWPKAVEAFAKALASGDLDASIAALAPQARIHRFDSSAREELWRLAGRAEKSTVVGHHAYIHPPLVMAADIAADFKNAAGIPEAAKAPFLVDDETAIKRANETAVQWVAEQLEASSSTPVGVIVLWAPRPLPVGIASTEAPRFEPLFLLCRGEPVAGHRFKINAIVYGNPAPELK